MDQGDASAARGDHTEALTFYRGAHAIMGVPTTAVELARAYARLGRLVEARDIALEVLRMPAGPSEPRAFSLARVEANELAKTLGDAIPVLQLELSAAHASAATLEIDGRMVPPAAIALPHALNPEQHRLVLSVPGFRPVDLRLVLEPGERRSLPVVLSPLPPARAAPLVAATRLARSRGLALEKPSAEPRGARRPSWLTWAGLGVAGAGLVTGTVAGLISINRLDAAKAWCTGNQCAPGAAPDRDAALAAANISNLGWATAGVGVVVSIIDLWLLGRSSDAAAVKPGQSVPAPNHGGMLRLEGSYF